MRHKPRTGCVLAPSSSARAGCGARNCSGAPTHCAAPFRQTEEARASANPPFEYAPANLTAACSDVMWQLPTAAAEQLGEANVQALQLSRAMHLRARNGPPPRRDRGGEQMRASPIGVRHGGGSASKEGDGSLPHPHTPPPPPRRAGYSHVEASGGGLGCETLEVRRRPKPALHGAGSPASGVQRPHKSAQSR